MKEAFKGSGISPPSVEFTPGHFTPVDIVIVDIGDLQLSAAGWDQGFDNVEDRSVIKVNANDGKIGFRVLRFLFNAKHTISIELRHAKPLRIFNTFEQDLCSFTLLCVIVSSRPNIPFDN